MLILTLTNVTYSASNRQIKNELAQGLYFSALDSIAIKYKYQSPPQGIKSILKKLTRYTGSQYFNTYGDIELRKLNIPSTHLIMAKRNLYLSKYKYTHKRLAKIPKEHYLYPEAMLIKATSFYKRSLRTKAQRAYNDCIEHAHKWETNSTSKRRKYFAVIKETCLLNKARIQFRNQEYKNAIFAYESIPKKSYLWPYTLIEKAWSYYYLKDYNRSLGILMTYNSPLLQSYFKPEAEYLKALNYFRLCLYKDSLDVINKYYTQYKPKSDKLRSVLNTAAKTKLGFYKIMRSSIKKEEKKNKFMRNVITQMSKRVKYNLDLSSLTLINKELTKRKNQKLQNIKLDIKEQMNHYIKVSMYGFINEIHEFSKHLFELKLELLSNARNLAYKNKKQVIDKKRGHLKNIQATPDKDLWQFKKAFWADELGEYTFALNSACKSKKIKLTNFRR